MKLENKTKEFSSIFESLEYGYNIKDTDYSLNLTNVQACQASTQSNKKSNKLF